MLPRKKRAAPIRRARGARAPASRALAQGVGATVNRPFQQQGTRPRNVRSLMKGFDATSAVHLPLPRAVGPYAIIRTTQAASIGGVYSMFCPMLALQDGSSQMDSRWGAACGIVGVGSGANAINSTNGTSVIQMAGMASLGDSAMVTPAAMTVQVINPGALLSTSGNIYIGRSHAQLEVGGSARTWDDLGQQFVSFMSPRLCSAGKLAMRGVKVSSYPLDMSELADFRGINPYGTTPLKASYTWASNDMLRPAGFAPIVVYNPEAVPLDYLITIEWRVRFDIGNPAASGHRYQGITSDAVWDAATRAAAALGHGAVDIVEDVAEAGAEGLAAAAAISLM